MYKKLSFWCSIIIGMGIGGMFLSFLKMNVGDAGTWFSGIFTGVAVIVALFGIHISKVQDEKNNRPELMINTKRYGMYAWYNKEIDGLSRNKL